MDAGSEIMKQFYARFLSLRTLKLPLVAAINGPAIGAGMCISLFADVRVAARDAKLGFTFATLGLHPVTIVARLMCRCELARDHRNHRRAWPARISFR